MPQWQCISSFVFYIYQNCTVLATKYPFFNTKHPVIILRASLFVVTPSPVASLKIECQNFSYVYRSRKHWECKYYHVSQLFSPFHFNSTYHNCFHRFTSILRITIVFTSIPRITIALTISLQYHVSQSFSPFYFKTMYHISLKAILHSYFWYVHLDAPTTLDECHAQLYLNKLCRAARNGKQSKNSKWKYLSPVGLEPVAFCTVRCRLRPLGHADRWYFVFKSLTR